MPEVPAGRVLIGLGQGELFRVAEDAPDERQAGRVSFFVEAVGHQNTRLACQICDARVHGGHRVRRVIGIVKRDDVSIDIPHDARHFAH